MKSFLFLHKAGLQSKITSARNGVCLPPCNALTNKTHPESVTSLYRWEGCCFSHSTPIYLPAIKKAAKSQAAEG